MSIDLGRKEKCQVKGKGYFRDRLFLFPVKCEMAMFFSRKS